MNNKGITLVELLVVISVTFIIIVAVGFSFQGWIGKYRVESQVKEMYADFMYARARAMEKGRVHFITNTATTYTMYEDTNPVPDGNGALEAGTNCVLGSGTDCRLPTFPKTVQYPVNWAGIGGVGTAITFSKNGIIAPSGSIFMTTTNDADYDCMNISPIKIYMGKKNATTSTICDSK